jgi:chromosome segregation ATPase
VPENDVFAAADAVLARGERPTVERVRLELGRGSPARVGGLLDQWWSRLAERLNGETRLPALPGEVSQAFVAVWQQAIHLAQGVAEQALAEQRQVLATERERVAAVEDQARLDAAHARQHAAIAQAAQQASETRLADLEMLLEQRLAQLEDLQRQREALVAERSQAQQNLQAVQAQLQAFTAKVEEERLANEIYQRSVEDRAYREVDHAREEIKESSRKNKILTQQLEQLQRRLEAYRDELSQAQQSAAAQQARADTLEAQLRQQRKPATAKSKQAKPAAARRTKRVQASSTKSDTPT